MFDEYRDLISELKASNGHFQNLFDKHHALDQKIAIMTSGREPGTPEEIEILKKKKLAIKDELYGLLQTISLTRART